MTTAARLIAPVLEVRSWEAGFDWVVDQLRHDHPQIASEVLVVKALEHLNKRQFDSAIELLKSFERKEKHHKARAATNLAFLYLLEGDVEQATRFASLAVKHDRYNAKALVNMGEIAALAGCLDCQFVGRIVLVVLPTTAIALPVALRVLPCAGNCLCETGELERAKELFLEAIGVEADCVEAIFDLGLVNKQLGVYGEAIQAFEKLHTLVPSSPEVLYHLGNLHDSLGNHERAIKYFSYLVSRVKSDPAVLARLGHLFNTNGDETEAFRYHSDSFGYFPVNLDVISFLGIWYVKAELYEKAITYFERAAEVEPKEAKWRLMVASCYRRMQDPQGALTLYQAIHADFPDNMECLSYIVAICRDMGRPFSEYEEKLVRLEREQAETGADMDDSGDFGSAGPGGDDAGFVPGDSPPRGGSDSFVPAYDDSPGMHAGAAAAVALRGSGVQSGRASGVSARPADVAQARFAAPAQQGGAASGSGIAVALGRADDDDDFADADLDSMLTE